MGTGEQLWYFAGPVQAGPLQRADLEGAAERKAAGVRDITLPHPWSTSVIDAAGTFYVGSEEGQFYALRDENGDGLVSGGSEVDFIDALACFHGDGGPAISDKLMAVPTTDTLWVFKKDRPAARS